MSFPPKYYSSYIIMPPPKPKAAAAPVVKGTKKTFSDDDDGFDLDFEAQAGPSNGRRPRPSISDDGSEEDDESDDEMPEAVGMSASKISALKDLESAQE